MLLINSNRVCLLGRGGRREQQSRKGAVTWENGKESTEPPES